MIHKFKSEFFSQWVDGFADWWILTIQVALEWISLLVFEDIEKNYVIIKIKKNILKINMAIFFQIVFSQDFLCYFRTRSLSK